MGAIPVTFRLCTVLLASFLSSWFKWKFFLSRALSIRSFPISRAFALCLFSSLSLFYLPQVQSALQHGFAVEFSHPQSVSDRFLRLVAHLEQALNAVVNCQVFMRPTEDTGMFWYCPFRHFVSFKGIQQWQCS